MRRTSIRGPFAARMPMLVPGLVRALALVLAVSLALVACGTTAWPKTAAETSCAEWSDQMNAAQRSALGTAMLLALRASDGGTADPPDAVAKAYVNAIGDTCRDNPDAKVSTVAATLYNLSKDLQP